MLYLSSFIKTGLTNIHADINFFRANFETEPLSINSTGTKIFFLVASLFLSKSAMSFITSMPISYFGTLTVERGGSTVSVPKYEMGIEVMKLNAHFIFWD